MLVQLPAVLHPLAAEEGGERRGLVLGGRILTQNFVDSPAPRGERREPHYVEAQAGDWLGDSKSAQSQIKWLNRNWIQLVQPCGF